MFTDNTVHHRSWYHRMMKVFVGACVVVLALYLLAYGYVVYSFSGNASLPADCAVVFGAAVSRGSQPGPAITRRVAAAADLYRNDQIDRLILTGGRGEGNTSTEAEVMQRVAVRQGIARADMTLENSARNTWENLLNSRNLTEDCSSVVAISDQYHLGRIRLLAWRQHWFDLQLYPAQNREPAVGIERWSFQREVFAVLYYGLFLDYVWPMDPGSETSES
jgi:uncharacterized SAM-binding protein YcdF (DUF218 family)